MPALDELDGGVARRPRPTQRSSAELSTPARRLRRPADAARLARPPVGRRRPGGSTPHLPQARGPLPHRRAQDQQLHRPGAARARGWASAASSPRPARASTASRPRRSAALFGLPCEVYMGAEDVERQALNVVRMKLLGAKVHPGRGGHAHAQGRDERGAARLGHQRRATTHYLIGSVAGPHPYPTLVRELQAVIGREARAQILEAEGRLPDALVACVGGGSNAIGLFQAFVADAEVALLRRRGGGRRHRHRPARGDAGARARRRAARRTIVRAVRRRRADLGGALDQRRARLPGRRARARLPEGDAAARRTCRSPTRRRWRASSGWRAPRGSCARSRPRTRSRRCPRSRRRCPTAPSSSSTSRAAATRTWGRSRRVSA